MKAIVDAISAAVVKQVAEAFGLDASQLEAQASRPTVSQTVEQYRKRQTETAAPQVETRRRTRKANPSKVYSVSPRDSRKSLELRSNDADVYNYLVSHPASSARQIETATGLKRKSVESSIWYLRNHNADGKRVSQNRIATKHALVFSTDAE